MLPCLDPILPFFLDPLLTQWCFRSLYQFIHRQNAVAPITLLLTASAEAMHAVYVHRQNHRFRSGIGGSLGRSPLSSTQLHPQTHAFSLVPPAAALHPQSTSTPSDSMTSTRRSIDESCSDFRLELLPSSSAASAQLFLRLLECGLGR